MSQDLDKLELKEVGIIRNDFVEEVPEDYKKKISFIEIFEDYIPSLKGIEKNSHISVFFWLDRSERDIQQVHPMGDRDNPLTGVFATRAPVRPNPIGETICELLERDGNKLVVKGLDALNDTPVIDIKVYKQYDIEDPEYPDWAPEE